MASNKFEGILLVTDLDGTLLKKDKSISSENLEAIEYFKANGGKFTIITGRLPLALAGIDKIVNPNVPMCCGNGGMIYDGIGKKVLMAKTMSAEALELVKFVDENMPEIGQQINTTEHIWFTKYNEAMYRARTLSKLPDLSCHYSEINEPIMKLLFADMDTDKIVRLTKMLEKHPLMKKFDGVSSEPIYYEILPKGVSKGASLPILCDIIKTDIGRTIAIGDNNNDAEMLKTAKIGYAVANASEIAKKAADRITVSNEENAIAAVISEIDSGKIRI